MKSFLLTLVLLLLSPLTVRAQVNNGPVYPNTGSSPTGASAFLPYGTDTGTANAYKVTPSPAVTLTPLAPTFSNGAFPGGPTSGASASRTQVSQLAKNNITIISVATTGLSSPPTFSVSDNNENPTYLPLTPVCGSATSGAYGQFLYAVVPSASGGANVTYTATASAGSVTAMSVLEYSNISLANLKDNSGCLDQASGSGTTSIPGFAATNGDLVVGFAISSGGTVSAGAGFNDRSGATANGQSVRTEDQILSGSTATVSFSLTGGSSLLMGVAIKPLQAGAYGQSFTFKAANANTGTSTMDAGGGPVPLLAFDGHTGTPQYTTLQSGAIQAGTIYQATSDGLEWVLASSNAAAVAQGGQLDLRQNYIIPAQSLWLMLPPSAGSLGQVRYGFNIICPPVTPSNGCGAGKTLNFGWDYDGVAIIGNPNTFIGFLSSSEQFGNSQVFGNQSAENYAFNSGSAAGPLFTSVTAPTIASGFNTTGFSVSAQNGTLDFHITVGTGTATSTGVITLPAATVGWDCFATNRTHPGNFIAQSNAADSTTSATLTNFGTTFAATNWTNSDVIQVSCYGH